MAESKNSFLSKLAAGVTAEGNLTAEALAESGALDSDAVVDIVGDIVEYAQLNQSGALEITTGTVRWVAPKNINISKTTASVGTAPAGSSLIATLNKNGSTIDTLTIADGGTTDANTGLSLTVNSGDYLTVDITQVGSSTAGSDLNLIVEYTEG